MKRTHAHTYVRTHTRTYAHTYTDAFVLCNGHVLAYNLTSLLASNTVVSVPDPSSHAEVRSGALAFIDCLWDTLTYTGFPSDN